MADNPGNEDSYSYPQESSSTEYSRSSTTGSTEGYKTILRSRRMWITVGAIIAVWIVSYVLGMLYKEEEASSAVKKEDAAKVAVVQQQKKEDAADSKSSVVDNSRISNIQVSSKNNTSKIETLTRENSQLQSQVSELTNSMHDMHYQLDLLTSKISDISAHIKEMTKPKPIPKTIVIEKPKKVFNLRAVIVGRAWLEDSDGRTFTVSQGDSVEGYGKIKAIYPDEGFVTTTSGRIIQFGENDK